MDYFGTDINSCRNRVFGKEERTYLMGIAIFMIILLHFYCWFNGTRPWWIYFFSEGQTGVDIFLFLSAYGLEASIRKNGWKRFYCNRAKRILPVYFLFLFTLFVFFQNHVPIKHITIQIICQLSGFSLFQRPDFFSTGFEFDWFTPALILIYISFPVISFWLNRLLKYSQYADIIILIICIIISLLDFRFIHLPIKFLLYRLPIIIIGAITYIYIEKGKTNRLLTLYIILFFAGIFSNQHSFLTSSSVPIAMTVYAITQGHRPFQRTISLLGRHSYEIYLAHIFPVTNFLMIKPFENIYTFIFVTISWTILVATIYVIFQKYSNSAINSISIKK